MDTKKLKTLKRRVSILSVLAVFAVFATGSVSAVQSFDNATDTINATIPIFGAIANLVIAIFPVMIVVAMIGFMLGLFDSILGAVSSKMRVI